MTRRISTKLAATAGVPSPARAGSCGGRGATARRRAPRAGGGRPPSTASGGPSGRWARAAAAAAAAASPAARPLRRRPVRRGLRAAPRRSRAAGGAGLPRFGRAAPPRPRPSSRPRPPPATPGSRRRTAPPARRRPPTARSQMVSSSRRSCDTTRIVAGDSAQERLDRLAGGDVEVVRRLVEQQQVRRQDAQQRELEARPLAARQQPDLLEHVVAAEQEPGEVAARLAGRDRDRLEDARRGRSRRGSRRRAAGRGTPGWTLWPKRDRPVERRQVARDRPQERRLAGAVRPDDPDPLARAGRRGTGTVATVTGSAASEPSGRERAAARQVADGEVLEPDDELAASGPGRPASALPGSWSALPAFGVSTRCSPELLQPRLVLVHLHVLALAPVALDELDLARDRVRRATRPRARPRASRSTRWRW